MNNAIVDYKEESYIFFSIGLLEYNNQIIKIIDIRNILKLEAAPYNLNSKIIIVKTKNDVFGIIIDDVKEIRRINTLSMNIPPYDTEKSYLEAIYTDKEFSVTILNLENIERKINSPYSFTGDSKNSAATFLPKDTASKETLHRRRLHYARKTKEVTNEIIKSQEKRQKQSGNGTQWITPSLIIKKKVIYFFQ